MNDQSMAEERRQKRMTAVEGWRIMAFSLGGPLGNVLSRSFDLITTVVRDGSSDAMSIGYSLESLKQERELAMSRDGLRFEQLRNMLYGMSECIGTLMESIIEERGGGLQQLQPPLQLLQLQQQQSPQLRDGSANGSDTGLPTLRSVKTEAGAQPPSPDIVILEDQPCSSKEAQPSKSAEESPPAEEPTQPKTVPPLKIRRISEEHAAASQPEKRVETVHPQPISPNTMASVMAQGEASSSSKNVSQPQTTQNPTTKRNISGENAAVSTKKKSQQSVQPPVIPPNERNISEEGTSASIQQKVQQNDPYQPVQPPDNPLHTSKSIIPDKTSAPVSPQKKAVQPSPSSRTIVSAEKTSTSLHKPVQPPHAPKTVITAEKASHPQEIQPPTTTHVVTAEKTSVSQHTPPIQESTQTQAAPAKRRVGRPSSSSKASTSKETTQPQTVPPLIVKRARADDPAALTTSNRWKRSCVTNMEGFYNEDEEAEWQQDFADFDDFAAAAAVAEAAVATAVQVSRLSCSECDRTFESLKGFKRHAFTHKAVRCPDCNKFVAKEKLDRHLAERHARFSAEL